MYLKSYCNTYILHSFIRMGGGRGGRLAGPKKEKDTLPTSTIPADAPFPLPPKGLESLIELSLMTTHAAREFQQQSFYRN